MNANVFIILLWIVLLGFFMSFTDLQSLNVILEKDSNSYNPKFVVCPHSFNIHIHVNYPDGRNVRFIIQMKDNNRRKFSVIYEDIRLKYPLEDDIINSLHYMSESDSFYNYHIMVTIICINLKMKGVFVIGQNVFIISPQKFLYGQPIEMYMKIKEPLILPNYHLTPRGLIDHDILHFHPNQMPTRSIEIVVIFDQSYVDKHISEKIALHFIIEILTYLNMIMQQISISVYPVNISYGPSLDLSVQSDNLDEALFLISRYRRRYLRDVKHDTLLMMSSLLFPNFVGKAFISGMCNYEKSIALVSDYYNNGALKTASSIAHELGHLMGLNHDTNCFCYGNKQDCIMNSNPVNSHAVLWSNCSIMELQKIGQNGLDFCLKDLPEELPEFDKHSTTKCRANITAQCWKGKCCDLESCVFRPKGFICQNSLSKDCDEPGLCSGYLDFCVKNPNYAITKICNPKGNGMCYKGRCVSRDIACNEIFGQKFQSADRECYEDNNKGTNFQGYCSYQVDDNSKYHFNKCADKDVLCGVLKCQLKSNESSQTFSAQPNFKWSVMDDINSIAISSNKQCYFARYNTNLTGLIDPLIVPNGAPCGVDQYCLNQRCVKIL